MSLKKKLGFFSIKKTKICARKSSFSHQQNRPLAKQSLAEQNLCLEKPAEKMNISLSELKKKRNSLTHKKKNMNIYDFINDPVHFSENKVSDDYLGEKKAEKEVVLSHFLNKIIECFL